MQLSFVIPAHNEELYLGDCLASILKELERTRTTAEILVVNNASTDGTRRVALNYPGVKVVDEPAKGLTKARERGLRAASGDVLAYLDADTRLPSGWLDFLQKEFSKDEKIVAVSGPFRYYDFPPVKKFFAEFYWKLSAPLTYRFVKYMILGANFAAKREALLAIGGFDTEISFYGEDTDIARRLSKVGNVVFNMNFFVYGSARRLKEEGLIKTFLVYGINFIWGVLFHKPFTKRYQDIR